MTRQALQNALDYLRRRTSQIVESIDEDDKMGLVYDELIKRWEGLRLKAYLDTGGVWTIGWGHTKTVKPGMEITVEQAQELFDKDTKWAVNAVNNYVKVPLKQHQFDALVSFTYNVGATAFRKSTLLRELNSGNYQEAAEQFLRWKYDNGEVIRGLLNRRKSEKHYFLTGEMV